MSIDMMRLFSMIMFYLEFQWRKSSDIWPFAQPEMQKLSLNHLSIQKKTIFSISFYWHDEIIQHHHFLSWMIISLLFEWSSSPISSSSSSSSSSLKSVFKVFWGLWASEWSEMISLWPLICQINHGKWIAEMIFKDKHSEGDEDDEEDDHHYYIDGVDDLSSFQECPTRILMEMPR